MGGNDTFKENFDWQRKYYDDIEHILKNNAFHFIKIRPGTNTEDCQEATDFVVEIEGGEIATRIRRPDRRGYRDLTIRAVNGRGLTELHKLRDGFARYYLYCWTDDCGDICEYIIVDCDQLRDSGILNDEWLTSNHRRLMMNTDGRTGFYFWRIAELESAGCLVQRWIKGKSMQIKMAL